MTVSIVNILRHLEQQFLIAVGGFSRCTRQFTAYGDMRNVPWSGLARFSRTGFRRGQRNDEQDNRPSRDWWRASRAGKSTPSWPLQRIRQSFLDFFERNPQLAHLLVANTQDQAKGEVTLAGR